MLRASLSDREAARNRVGRLTDELAARHPFARGDVEHELQWRFGEFLPWTPRIAFALQCYFVEGLRARADGWHAESTEPYASDLAAVLAGADAIVLKYQRLAARLPLDASVADIRDAAAELAERNRALAMTIGPHERKRARARLVEGIVELGLVPPAERLGVEPSIARMTSPAWCRRKLSRAHARGHLAVARELGVVSSDRELYCSDYVVTLYRQQLEANAASAAAITLESESGKRITLEDARRSSEANPQNRAAALMVRVDGINAAATREKRICWFVTRTLPGLMHRRVELAGGAFVTDNPGFDPHWADPRTIHDEFLQPSWSRIRAALAREGITFAGALSVEPHHDGTPHWHLMAWVHEAQSERFCEVLRENCLNDEVGFKRGGGTSFKHRLEFKQVAAKYVSRYIAKYVLEMARADDVTAFDASSSPSRAAAWAWAQGIRRYRTFGHAPVGIWQGLRRMPADVNGMPNPQLAGAPQVARDAWFAAQRERTVDLATGEVLTLKSADFGAFVEVLGGLCTPRKAQPLRIARALAERRTRYGDPVHEVIGVEAIGARYQFTDAGELVEEPAHVLLTDDRERWRVVSVIFSGVAPPAARPRTRGNNCTGDDPAKNDSPARAPPDSVPAGDLPGWPLDRLDRELARAIASAGAGLWSWSRSTGDAELARAFAQARALPGRPRSDDELADAAALAADLVRLGPIPA